MAIAAPLIPLLALIGTEAATVAISQLVGQIIGAAIAPEIAGLQESAFRARPTLQISVADAVDAVIKGHLAQADAEIEASLSGVDAHRFGLLLANAGQPPGPQTLLEMWRRNIIPETGTGADSVSFEQGIREGLTKNKWINYLKPLRYQLPSPDAALQALLEGQTDEATARTLYAQWGGDDRYFKLMFDTRGSAPSPLEAAEMARRGIIPWDGEGAGVVSFRQAFLEGPWRNKWEPYFRSLADYIPPPRTVTAMVREGAMTDADALKWYRAAGLTQELAAIYLAAAHHQRVATTKDLAKGDVLALYTDKLIDSAQATTMLGKLNYSAENAAFELAIADFRQQRRLVEAALTRLRTLYIARKLDKPGAQRALDQLGLTPAARDNQLVDWDLVRQNTVAVLSAAELAAAVKQSWLDPDEALAELEGRGYSARDAWIYLATHLKAPPNASPPPGVGPRTS